MQRHTRLVRMTLLLTLATVLARTGTAGVKEGVVQCANLIYAGSKTSKCFSDEFLRQIERESTIRTARRFVAVKLASPEVFKFPFVVMTGEGSFSLTAAERRNLRAYLTRGGFLLASAGCSSKEWDRSFRREMRLVFSDLVEERKKVAEAPNPPAEIDSSEGILRRIPFDHAVFRTVNEIKSLPLSHGGSGYLEGVNWNGKLVVIYSGEGLNDTAHTTGCCCCGGNEVVDSVKMNMNILAYVLLH